MSFTQEELDAMSEQEFENIGEAASDDDFEDEEATTPTKDATEKVIEK